MFLAQCFGFGFRLTIQIGTPRNVFTIAQVDAHTNYVFHAQLWPPGHASSTNQQPLPSSPEGAVLAGNLNPMASPSPEQFPGDSYPILGSPSKASGGSGEGGRGIGEENLNLRGQDRERCARQMSPFRPHAEAAAACTGLRRHARISKESPGWRTAVPPLVRFWEAFPTQALL